jgi:hypothetical protein
MNDNSWKAVFDKYKIHEHNLEKELFLISAEQIKQATTHFKKTNEKEVRNSLQARFTRNRPKVFH